MTQEPRKGSKASITLRLNLAEAEWLRTIGKERELKSPAEALEYLHGIYTDALPKRIITNFGPLIREFPMGSPMASIFNTMRMIALEAITMTGEDQTTINDKLNDLHKKIMDAKKKVNQ